MRLDKYLTINDHCDSRNKAVALISEGVIKVNGITVTKPSFEVSDEDIVEIGFVKQYVSRSAKKLLTAIDVFEIDFNDKVAVDLGASTGGFCQVMLEHNAKHVYAVDVGTNQLHPSVAADHRITNIEHTNARYISKETFDKPVDVVTCDLSFISLKLILKAVYDVLEDGGALICLVKPQFEVGPQFVNKNGVVKDNKTRAKAVADIVKFAAQIGFNVCGVAFSGIEGESGNREYLVYMLKSLSSMSVLSPEQAMSIALGDK